MTNLETLHLNPKNVRRTFLEKLKIEQPRYEYLLTLEEIQNDKWLKRIENLRDHAHKWQIDPNLVEYNGDKVNVIAIDNYASKDEGLPTQINIDKNDLWFMKDAVEKIGKEGFFEQ